MGTRRSKTLLLDSLRDILRLSCFGVLPDSSIFIRRKDLRMSPTDLAVQEQQASGSASASSTISASRSRPSTARAARRRTSCCCARSSRWACRSRARTCSRRTSPGCRPGTRSAPASDGYIARKKEVDFLVAMNAETAKEDVLTLEPGARRRLRRAAEAERAAQRPASSTRCRSTSSSRRSVPTRSCAASSQHDLRRRPRRSCSASTWR